MDAFEVNQHLARGDTAQRGVLPKLDELAGESFVFKHDFGLDALPTESGVILIRGPRQYGKSVFIGLRARRPDSPSCPAKRGWRTIPLPPVISMPCRI